ncbi:hypothetical protein Rhopal_002275-T1 [Rhodotorula paludigena]|uniref:F-box domain-containing protein n=1 Tax=Rhodotorula paludigena TaxID=86838 RepID=A0AAV5GIJ5_9BASI|nr:hypothetical protein Rhopal_002275-T1 [Rhodotorula paludigena]
MTPSLRKRTVGKGSQASTKRAPKRSKASVTPTDGETDAGSMKAPPTKKSRKGGKVKAAPAGQDLFSSLPIDLLYQVCRDLEPGELLAISQVNRAVHRTLASKAAEPLWVAVRKMAKLPDLKIETSEIQYAFLVQGWACQVCGGSKYRTQAEHTLRIRACNKCLKANYYWLPDVLKQSQLLFSLDPHPLYFQRNVEGFQTKENLLNAAVLDHIRARKEFKQQVSTDNERLVSAQTRLVDNACEADRQKMAARRAALAKKVKALGYEECDVDAVKRQRLATEHHMAQLQRQQQLRPLYHQLLASASHSDRIAFPFFRDWLELLSVKSLWEPLYARVDPSGWHSFTSAILADVRTSILLDKVFWADKLARTMQNESPPLAPAIVNAITQESSAFVDPDDERKGLAPLHAQLSSTELDSVLERATALLECTRWPCSLKLPYRGMLEHLKTHSGNLDAEPETCQLASTSFVQLVRDMLKHAGMDDATTHDRLFALGSVFKVKTKAGIAIDGLDWRTILQNQVTQVARPAYWAPWMTGAVDHSAFHSVTCTDPGADCDGGPES